MATSVSATVQVPVGGSARAATTLRRCGRCRCPGHTRGRCPVFKPVGTHYVDLGNLEAEQAAVRRNAADELQRIRGLGLTPMTRYECTQRWCASPRGDAQRLRPGELERLQDGQAARREELQAALENRSTVPRVDAAIHEIVRIENEIARLRNEYNQSVQARTGAPAPPSLPPRAAPAPVPTPPTVSPPAPPKVLDKPVEETTCAICLDELTECNKFITPCGHQFHAGCVMKCMVATRKNRCPTCREKVM